MDSAADFYSNRVPKKQRKSTLVDELLADAEFKRFNKRKYGEIVAEKAKETRRFRKKAARTKASK